MFEYSDIFSYFISPFYHCHLFSQEVYFTLSFVQSADLDPDAESSKHNCKETETAHRFHGELSQSIQKREGGVVIASDSVKNTTFGDEVMDRL